ncbi:uncharacterized protein LOC131610708 [Vicia villosa]|uniref:uncharacterized protein LOC131610708 n=1 Tax=Vicia villosa TaxID=3911 RepID=UPI00273BEF5A|nr:uncharacterized protein LOC131610708 [Vicia villosa]XP_058738715.1 uncharacterized protein LOC131610708 [Vicia villosa]XP_058738716.1 uncharacterized protein LOC131610708 [Vicia villosa]
MDEYWKTNGEIPAFGNWDFVNEFPITQYFENARQAGLIRYSSSSGDTDVYVRGEQDLYTVDYMKPVGKETRNRETRMKKQGKVYDVTEYPRKQMNSKKTLDVNGVVRKSALQTKLPKPVDEDLYKISPQLLRKTKRKKMLGFISMCLVPAACVS